MVEMRKKDRQWLERIRLESDSLGGMYAGMRADHLPSGPANRLYKGGYIVREIPHNPVHKDRWLITYQGRKALENAHAR